MKSILAVIPFITLLNISVIAPTLAATPTCIDAIKTANQQLAASGEKTVKDEKTLENILITLNSDDVLPTNYVTSTKAKQLGWSGKPDDSIWNIWALNKKVIGGDKYTGKPVAAQGAWYSADLDTIRGLRSNKHLIYSPDSSARFISTDNDQKFIPLSPCK